VKSGVFEETDLDTNGDDLTKVRWCGGIFAARAEMTETKMAGSGELQAGGQNRSVEINDRAELNLDTKLHGGGGECSAV